MQRVGEASYQIRTSRSVAYDVHRDQLKPCVWDTELGESYPLVFRAADMADQRPQAPVVDRVLDHRSVPGRGLEFQTRWLARDGDFVAWEPASNFLHGCPDPWLAYGQEEGLPLDLHEAMESAARTPDLGFDPPEDEE